MLNSNFAKKRHLGAFWSRSYRRNEIFTLYVQSNIHILLFAYFRWKSTSSNCPRNRLWLYQSNLVSTSVSGSGLFKPLSFLLSFCLTKLKSLYNLEFSHNFRIFEKRKKTDFLAELFSS